MDMHLDQSLTAIYAAAVVELNVPIHSYNVNSVEPKGGKQNVN